MLIKTAIIFLAAMLLLALVGRAVFPGGLRRDHGARPATCPACGRFVIGKGPCDCDGSSRKRRA